MNSITLMDNDGKEFKFQAETLEQLEIDIGEQMSTWDDEIYAKGFRQGYRKGYHDHEIANSYDEDTVIW